MIIQNNLDKLPIFKEDTLRYVEVISGDIHSNNIFTVIGEGLASRGRKITYDLCGSIHDLYEELLRYNRRGFGVFMVVNKCGSGRSAKNTTDIRANFFDDDADSITKLPLAPSLLVQSGRGKHGYYLPKETLPLGSFKPMQKAIADSLGTDSTVSDLPRLMRVPGFAHMKDPGNPKPVRILEDNDCRYTLSDLNDCFTKNESTQVVAHAREISTSGNASAYFQWIEELSIDEGAANENGGRNNTALKLVREGYGLSLSEEDIYKGLAQYCAASGLAFEEVEAMLEKQKQEHNIKNFQSFFIKKQSGKISFSLLAERFLKDSGYVAEDGQYTLAYWRGDFYFYDGTKYKKLPSMDLKPKIVSLFRNDPKLKEKFKKVWIEEIISHLQGVYHIESWVEPGTDLKNRKEKNHLVFLANGILKLKPRESWGFDVLPNDPRYFTQVSLPYAYETEATCPRFMKFLSEVITEQDTRDFLQEWFGYNLIHDTSQSKFVVLVGEGANGKSVLLSLLAGLLGQENVSAIPLESFNAARTFPMAVTIGKLANIVDEMGDLRGVESTVKQFVSGSVMNVERKGKDGSEQKPTARLTFATNNLPSFKDRSDGLWRRLIVIPMTVQLLDESKQDKNLTQIEYWQEAGEMAGILNWAIEGLQRLMRRGQFREPSSSVLFKKGYRADSDSVAQFLEEFTESLPDASVGASELYGAYVQFARQCDEVPVTAASFSQAVKKSFPHATRSENARAYGGRRERVWQGIQIAGGSY